MIAPISKAGLETFTEGNQFTENSIAERLRRSSLKFDQIKKPESSCSKFLYLGKSLANDYTPEWAEEQKIIAEEENAKAERRRKEAEEIGRRVQEGKKPGLPEKKSEKSENRTAFKTGRFCSKSEGRAKSPL